MKDYKRLTTRNEKGEWTIELNEEQKMLQRILLADEFVSALFDLIAQRLCDLEDKIENGTLVELPCKVGTTIYHLYKAGDVITEDKVFNYHFEICSKPCASFENHFWYGTKKRVDTILVEHFGKYWFTDKAEAKAKLRELKG